MKEIVKDIQVAVKVNRLLAHLILVENMNIVETLMQPLLQQHVLMEVIQHLIAIQKVVLQHLSLTNNTLNL